MVGSSPHDFGDEPSSGPGSVVPPAVRPRAHDVVAVHEDSGLCRPGHAVLRSPSCRRCCTLPCQGTMILGEWARDTMAMRSPASDCADGADCDCAGIRRSPRPRIHGRLIDQCMASGTSSSPYETGFPPFDRGRYSVRERSGAPPPMLWNYRRHVSSHTRRRLQRARRRSSTDEVRVVGRKHSAGASRGVAQGAALQAAGGAVEVPAEPLSGDGLIVVRRP